MTPGQRLFLDQVELGGIDPLPQIGIVADQRLYGQLSDGFRVTVSDRR